MKRFIALLMALVMCLALCACGSEVNAKDEVKAKEAYDKLVEVYNLVDQIGGDIYQIWAKSSTDKSKLLEDPINYILNNSHLEKDDLLFGFLSMVTIVSSGAGSRDETLEHFLTYSEEEKEYLLNTLNDADIIDSFFSRANPLTDFCVFCVINSYYLNGDFAIAQEKLDEAKAIVKDLQSSNFGGMEALNSMYTDILSYYNYCLEPTGSLVQASETISDLRASISESMNSLELFF